MQIVKISQYEMDRFNRNLLDAYGYWEGYPKFRLVWSSDIIEKRQTRFTREGFELLTPLVVELPKYKQWNNDRYVIEMINPIGNNPELACNHINYEPFYTFENKAGEFLVPNWTAAKVIIDTMLEIAGVTAEAKYKLDNEEERRKLIARVDEIETALYGNESKIGDALARDSAVGYGVRQRNDSFDPAEKIKRATEEIKS